MYQWFYSLTQNNCCHLGDTFFAVYKDNCVNCPQSPIPIILRDLNANQLFCAFQTEMGAFRVEVECKHFTEINIGTLAFKKDQQGKA